MAEPKGHPFAREVRSTLLSLIVGVAVLIISYDAGTHDPLGLLWRVLIALIAAWLLFEILQTHTVSSRLPLAWVGFGSHRRVLAKEPDQVLAQRVDAVVNGITELMGTHIRNEPDFHAGGDIQEWQQQQDRRGRHERNTTGRFFEQYGSEILNTAEALRRRNVLTEDEYRSVVWQLQTAGYSMVHELPRLAAQFAAASRKLRGQD